MEDMMQRLFKMFYPLAPKERKRWARQVALDDEPYRQALEQEARVFGLAQRSFDDAVAWTDARGAVLLLFFRILDPRDLDAVRRVYETIARSGCFCAYVFLHQLPDGTGTWDVFQLSRLSWLAHCNRLSGPGSEVPNQA
jgi:hypothetical protein